MQVNGFGHDSRPMGTPQNAPKKISVIAETDEWQQEKLRNLATSKAYRVKSAFDRSLWRPTL